MLCLLVPDMQRKAKVGVGLWAGLIPENAHDPALLQSLVDKGAAGFKSFMSPAGPLYTDLSVFSICFFWKLLAVAKTSFRAPSAVREAT